MDRLNILTELGVIPLVGRLHADARSPVLLAVGGIFPTKTFLHDLVDHVSPASGEVVVAALPGMHTPGLRENSIAAFARTYDAVVERLFGDRPVVTLGMSSGALATLSMRAPTLRTHIAVEPFFSSQRAGAGALERFMIDRIRNGDGQAPLHRYLYDIFGGHADAPVDRNYDHVLSELDVETHVVMGGLDPGDPALTEILPTLTGPEDHARLAAHPKVTMHPRVADAGHNVLRSAAGGPLVVELARQALARAHG